MKIIEPRRSTNTARPITRHIAKIIPLIVLVVIVSVLRGAFDRPANPQPTETDSQQQDVGTILSEQTSNQQPRLFTAEEFHSLYLTQSYPNTQEITTPPYITGNVAADERIRAIAGQRGYHLTLMPVSPIVRTGELDLVGDDLLQEKALAAWQELKMAAHAQGAPLTLVSGYRSIDFQRQLFLERLRASGASNEALASGQADNLIVKTLMSAAPPGYSRHHTGYTIDLACGRVGLKAFLNTVCFTWLSSDNYANAKLYGWAPSYPEGANAQGPEPEPWEYVWVGKQALTTR